MTQLRYAASARRSRLFELLGAGVLTLLLALATALPAQAQMEDGELPEIDFAVNVMQSAQWLGVDATNALKRDNLDDDHAGFHRIRAGLNLNVQFHERVSALVMIESEPNDFGGLDVSSQFEPQIDFAVMDVQLSDALTFRAGTPVTGLFKFRGYSDGPVVQGNPVIGNSPADMITAGQGVKLIGSFESVGFDLTINRGFGESFDSGGTTGVDLLGNVTIQPSDTYGLGLGVATATGNKLLQMAAGDGENYNLTGSASASRETHAAMPGETVIQGDAMVNVSDVKVSAWGGFATGRIAGATINPAVNSLGDDAQAAYAGVNARLDASESVFFGLRGTVVANVSDEADSTVPTAEFDESTSLSRIEANVGITFFDAAMLKIGGLRQVEGINSFGQIGNNWFGVATELSFAF
jgi:hypothetical protein